MFGNLGKFGFLIAFYAKREDAAQFLQNAIRIYVSPYITDTICTNAGRIMAQFIYTCICSLAKISNFHFRFMFFDSLWRAI